MKIARRQIRKIVRENLNDMNTNEEAHEDVRDLAAYDALNGNKDPILYRDNPDYREVFDQMTMRESRKKRRNFILESRAESLLGLPRNPSPQAVYHSIKNYISNIPDPSKDPNADLIDRVIANVMVKHQIRKDDEHIGSKLNMLRRILDPDKARVDSYRRGVESEMRELDPTGKKQKYGATPNSLRMGESKMKITERQLRQIIKEEKSKILSEVNPDGTISPDEEELEDELTADIIIELENLIAQVRGESMKIGGDYRGPGIRARIFKEMRAILERIK